jgi:hypothetical protein
MLLLEKKIQPCIDMEAYNYHEMRSSLKSEPQFIPCMMILNFRIYQKSRTYESLETAGYSYIKFITLVV